MSIVKQKQMSSWDEVRKEGEELLKENPEFKPIINDIIKAVEKWDSSEKEIEESEDDLMADCRKIIAKYKMDEPSWRLAKKIAKKLNSTIAYGMTFPSYSEVLS